MTCTSNGQWEIHMSHTRRANRTVHCAFGTVFQDGDRGATPEGSELSGGIEISDGVEILGPIKAGGGCMLHPGVILDTGVELGSDVIVGPDTIVGEGSRIGSGSRIGIACTIDSGVTIGKNARIGDGIHIKTGAVLKDGVVIGTEDGGTVIGLFSKIGLGSEIQGTMNHISKRGVLVEVDAVKEGKRVPKKAYVNISQGINFLAYLSPQPA